MQLLALTGVGFTPQFVWATTDAKPRLFAYIFPGFLQLIEDGWQSNADALEATQKTAESKALVDLQQRLAHPIKGSTLIRNARVFDSEKATLHDSKVSVMVTRWTRRIRRHSQPSRLQAAAGCGT